MKKKTIALLLVLMMVFGITCGGTIAYLTSQTDAVVNTFTVGNVAIKLTEHKVDAAGKATEELWDTDVEYDANTVLGNAYKLIPGGEYAKDPTVTVKGGSEESYVRMMVTVTYAEDADEVLTEYDYAGWMDSDNTVWVPEQTVETDRKDGMITRTYEFRYKETVTALTDGDDEGTAADDVPLPALFTEITVPGDITNEELAKLDSLSISVEAHAIQAAGFADATAAWAAFAE